MQSLFANYFSAIVNVETTAGLLLSSAAAPLASEGKSAKNYNALVHNFITMKAFPITTVTWSHLFVLCPTESAPDTIVIAAPVATAVVLVLILALAIFFVRRWVGLPPAGFTFHNHTSYLDDNHVDNRYPTRARIKRWVNSSINYFITADTLRLHKFPIGMHQSPLYDQEWSDRSSWSVLFPGESPCAPFRCRLASVGITVPPNGLNV